MVKKIGIILLNLVIMLLIVLGVTLWWLPNWLNDVTGHNEKVVVPLVVGSTVETAMQQLEAKGLRPMVIDTVYSDGSQPGEVLEQLPEGNLPVKPNRIVYLTINAFDVLQVTFPDIIEYSSRQAQSELRALRFVADSIRYEPYDTDDQVLRVTNLSTHKEMQAGEVYPVRTKVILHVGSTQLEVEGKTEESESGFYN